MQFTLVKAMKIRAGDKLAGWKNGREDLTTAVDVVREYGRSGNRWLHLSDGTLLTIAPQTLVNYIPQS